MRKILIWTLVFLLSASILMLTVDRVQAVDYSPISRSWIGCAFKEHDPFYDKKVFAYETGSTAILVVTVKNDYSMPPPITGKQLNVSTVRVSFDWGTNYTISFDPPVEVPEDESRVFTVTFSVPGTSVASNLFLHAYTIFVEHVNSTTGPKKVLEENTIKRAYDPDFAVYSTVQADAQELNQTLSGMPEPTYYYYYSYEAKLICLRADNETATGSLCYIRGDFADAKMHYQKALDLRSQAYSTAESYASRYDNAMIRQLESTANVFSGLSTAMTLIGAATVLFGVGYIIKNLGNLRKPKKKHEAPT